MYSLTDQRIQELENTYTYHSPNSTQIPRYQELREKGLEMAILIERLVPPGRARSTAQTKLEEVIMFANKGIACDEK